MFKIMKRFEVVEWEKRLNVKARTRRHNLGYNRESFKSRRRKIIHFSLERKKHKYFINRVAPSWNMSPSNVINSSSLNGFKVALYKFTENGHLST